MNHITMIHLDLFYSQYSTIGVMLNTALQEYFVTLGFSPIATS